MNQIYDIHKPKMKIEIRRKMDRNPRQEGGPDVIWEQLWIDGKEHVAMPYQMDGNCTAHVIAFLLRKNFNLDCTYEMICTPEEEARMKSEREARATHNSRS